MAPLYAALLLAASFAFGDDAPSSAQGQLNAAAGLSQSAAGAPTDSAAKDGAAVAIEGGVPNGDAVADDGTRTIRPGAQLSPASPTANASLKNIPPPPSKPATTANKISTGLMLGGAAFLGGLQGWLAAGVAGAAAGAALGLGAAWLFHKGDYGGAFGMTAGAIVGTALGGPLGGLIGAAVGGLAGHFLGKLFL
jgi:hypothetical protein